MGAGQRPAAQPRVAVTSAPAPSSRRRPSPSSPRAGARRSRAAGRRGRRRAMPAEEDVARGLHQPLAVDHALARGSRRRSRPAYGSRTDGWASLTWRNSGSPLVAAEQQGDPGARADAADADDLARHVDEAVAVEQVPAVVRQRRPVAAQEPLHRRSSTSSRSSARQQVLDRHDSGGSLTIRGSPVDVVGELRERPHAVLASGPWRRLLEALGLLPALASCASSCEQSLDVERAYQTSRLPMLGEPPHRRRGTPRRRRARPPRARGSSNPRSRAGDLEAGGEPLDVPLPRTRQGLVEVVDVEDELAVRGREGAEVREVGVTAELHRRARCAAWPRGRRP